MRLKVSLLACRWSRLEHRVSPFSGARRRGIASSKRPLSIACAALVALTASAPVHAEETLSALNIQQDAFLARDGGGYTSGAFATWLRLPSPGQGAVTPAWLLRPVTEWLGGTAPSMAETTLGQVILTPVDLSETAASTDSPYLGALFVRSAHATVNGDTSDLYALALGVIGPASGAADTQRAVHRATGSTPPQGWHRQVPNRALVGIERYRSWRAPLRLAPGAAGSAWDLIGVAGGNLSTLETSIGATVVLRYGQGLERSYPLTARLAARGVDPIAPTHTWFAYVAASLVQGFYHAGFGIGAPEASTGAYRRSQDRIAAGIAFGWNRASLTLAIQSASPLAESNRRRQAWGSLTFAWTTR